MRSLNFTDELAGSVAPMRGVVAKHLPGQHNQKDHAGKGGGVATLERGEVSADDISAAFEGTYTTDSGVEFKVVTLQTDVQQVHGVDMQVAGGALATPEGKFIGEWARAVDNNTGEMHALFLTVGRDIRGKDIPGTEDFRHKGIALTMQKHTEAAARELGCTHITVYAAQDGTAAWAQERFGYRFSEKPQLRGRASQSMFHEVGRRPEVQERLRRLEERLDSDNPADWPAPHEILNVGGPDRDYGDVAGGKTYGEFLLSWGWHGVKDASHVTKAAGLLTLTVLGEDRPAIVKFAPGLRPVLKHLPGQHDQKTHARRFPSTVDPAVAAKAIALVGENGGLSIKMTDGSEPPDGYMVARDSAKFGTALTADEFYGPDGAKALGEFLIRNRSELGSGRAYLGVWHQTSKVVDGVEVPLDRKDQVVHLDVTDRITQRDRAVRLGRRRNQISIWDVANFEEIQTGGTGAEVAKGTVGGRDPQAADRDDRRRDHGLGGASSRADGRGRLEAVLKHPGHADQKVHGRRGSGGSLPAGWEKVNDRDLERALAERLEATGEADRPTARYIAKRRVEEFATYGGPGGTTVLVARRSGLTDDDLRDTMEMVTRLQQSDPKPGMEIEISDSAFRDHGIDDLGYGGFAYVNRPNLYLRPATVKKGLEPGALMPSVVQHPRVYGLVHEWGHTVDHRDGTTAAIDHNAMLGLSGHRGRQAAPRERRNAADVFAELESERAAGSVLSMYGASDKRESWAEAFAEFHLNPSSATSNPVVSYFTERYNWGSGGSEGMDKATAVEICADTFTADGPATRTMVPPTLTERFGPTATVIKFAPGLRPVLKHGSPGDPGYSAKHPGGASGPGDGKYAAWGDRAAEIQRAERYGPDERTLRDLTAVPTLTPEEINERVLDEYAYQVDDLTDERYNDWLDEHADQDLTPEQVADIRHEIRAEAERDVIADNAEYVAISMREEIHEDRMAMLSDHIDTDDFDQVYGTGHSVTLDDGTEDMIGSSVHTVDYEYGSPDEAGIIVVKGYLYNDNGDDIGEFERRFTTADDGSLMVSHELLVISDERYQGKGFAQVFNRQAENYYASHGVKGIAVHAALDGGGYAWARQGFDFTNPGSVPWRVEAYLAQRGDGLHPAVKADLSDISRRFQLRRDDPDYPTPAEIALLGHVPGATQWPGKSIMRGADWFGLKPVAPTGRRSTTQQRREWERDMDAYANRLTREQIPGQTSLDRKIHLASTESPGQGALFGVEPSVVDAEGNVT